MSLGSKSIKSLSREYTYREDEMTDEYACGDVARMPTSLLRRVLRWPNLVGLYSVSKNEKTKEKKEKEKKEKNKKKGGKKGIQSKIR